jgi:hypothetical protein
MQLIVTISDELETVNLTEGGLDHFSITDFSLATVYEESNAAIGVYPNPANDLIYVSGITEGFVMITDLSGRMVLESLVQPYTDISTLNSGIYLIQILDETGQIIYTQKLIVQ